MTGKHRKETKSLTKSLTISLRPLFARAGTAAAITLGIGGVAFGAYELRATEAPASAGVTYLENRGFSHVARTEDPFISTCGQYARPHSFTAIKDGKETPQTLCFGPAHRISPAPAP
jgi:hypothetical protein